MRLRAEVVKKINNSQARMRIALALKCTEAWIMKCLKANKEDGFLTKVSALMAITKETGLSQEEILTEEVDSETGRVKVIQD